MEPQEPPQVNPATQPGSTASATGAGPSQRQLVRSKSTTGIGASSAVQPRRLEQPKPTTGGGSKTHRVNLDDLEAVHNICEGQNEPLRNEIRDLQTQIAALDPSDDVTRQIQQLKLDNLEFQQRQEMHMQKLMACMPSAETIANLARDVGTVRQDHNSLMEQSSRVNPRAVENTFDPEVERASPVDPQKDRIRELEEQLAQYRQQGDARSLRAADNDPPDRRRQQSPASDYSSDDDPAYYQAAYRGDSEDPTSRIRFYDRPKGPAYLNLRAERPSDPTFDRLMNYRFYRLQKRRASRDADAMIDGQRRLKALQRSLDSVPRFDGKDPILVFAFLTRFTEEADLNGLTEAQALLALPRFLKEDAALAFQTAQSSGQSGGVNSWSEAVHFLLTTYATPSAMREAVIRVQEMKQKVAEDELAYNARLSQAIYRCGNVFSEAQKTTYFVNGLLPDIRSRVARYREGIPRHAVRYNKIVQYARDEGETVRAQQTTVRTVPKRQALSNPSQAHLLYENGEPTATDNRGAEGVFLAEAGNPSPTSTVPVSDNTSDLPSTQDLEGGNGEELYMVRPPRVPFSDRHTDKARPGWKAKNPLVCFSCFVKDNHIAPDCTADPLDFALVVHNYEALTPQERMLAPNGLGTYTLAKRCLAASQATPANPTGSKN